MLGKFGGRVLSLTHNGVPSPLRTRASKISLGSEVLSSRFTSLVSLPPSGRFPARRFFFSAQRANPSVPSPVDPIFAACRSFFFFEFWAGWNAHLSQQLNPATGSPFRVWKRPPVSTILPFFCPCWGKDAQRFRPVFRGWPPHLCLVSSTPFWRGTNGQRPPGASFVVRGPSASPFQMNFHPQRLFFLSYPCFFGFFPAKHVR